MNTASERKQIRDMNHHELVNLANSLQQIIESGSLLDENVFKAKQNLIEIRECYRQITGRPLTKETIERELK